MSDSVRVHPRTETPRGRSPEAAINTLGVILPNRATRIADARGCWDCRLAWVHGELSRLDSQFITAAKHSLQDRRRFWVLSTCLVEGCVLIEARSQKEVWEIDLINTLGISYEHNWKWTVVALASIYASSKWPSMHDSRRGASGAPQ
jgi:hypothetical protein